MTLTVLNRFRKGLREGRFTMTQLSDLSGIPLTTLSDMKDEDWGERLIGRLASLEAALDEVDPPRKRKPTRREAATA